MGCIAARAGLTESRNSLSPSVFFSVCAKAQKGYGRNPWRSNPQKMRRRQLAYLLEAARRLDQEANPALSACCALLGPWLRGQPNSAVVGCLLLVDFELANARALRGSCHFPIFELKPAMAWRRLLLAHADVCHSLLAKARDFSANSPSTHERTHKEASPLAKLCQSSTGQSSIMAQHLGCEPRAKSTACDHSRDTNTLSHRFSRPN